MRRVSHGFLLMQRGVASVTIPRGGGMSFPSRGYCTTAPLPPPPTSPVSPADTSKAATAAGAAGLPPPTAPTNPEEHLSIMKDMRDTIADEKVVLFMKGTPESPVCGFSKRVADIMDAIQVEYTAFNVLAHPTVRTGVKEISGWPTIPQLFVCGEFIGGCDILMEMSKNGQLYDLLDLKEIKHKKVNFS